MARSIYGDRWQVVGPIGEGGQAHAFRVRDRTTDSEEWVLKRLKNTKRLGRFDQEIQALQAINSPRIPKVEDYSIKDPAYLVYPYLGTTLEKVVEEEDLTFDEGLDLYRDVVEAVVDAHREGVIHRDIKPGNVVVDEARQVGRRAYLIDFGICQFDSEGCFTTTGEALGSRGFAPPEFDVGSGVVPDAKSDIYSLGKLLYWVLSGGQMFSRENLTEERLQRIPQPRGVERTHVKRLLQQMVRDNPSARPAAGQILAAVERVAVLMRQGVSAVGSANQLCPICRVGTLNRRERQPHMGYAVAGGLPPNIRVLRCNYCGYLQLHDLEGTQSQQEELWEI